MTYLTILSALGGGALIGLAAALLLFFNNRTAGISGIAAAFCRPGSKILAGGYGFWPTCPQCAVMDITRRSVYMEIDAPLTVLAIAGLLWVTGPALAEAAPVAMYLRNARLSARSIAATLLFMTTAASRYF